MKHIARKNGPRSENKGSWITLLAVVRLWNAVKMQRRNSFHLVKNLKPGGFCEVHEF